MDLIQQQFERAVGDKLIEWINSTQATAFSFSRRGDDAPDLIYSDGTKALGIEVVGAYYDKEDATLQWKGARQLADAPAAWSGINFDEALLKNIERRISEKCKKAYGPNCALLVAVRPGLTPMPDMQDLLAGLQLPEAVSFEAIYIAGEFPATTYAKSGYYAWQVWAR